MVLKPNFGKRFLQHSKKFGLIFGILLSFQLPLVLCLDTKDIKTLLSIHETLNVFIILHNNTPCRINHIFYTWYQVRLKH